MQSRTFATVLFTFALAAAGASGCDRWTGPRETSPSLSLVSPVAPPARGDPGAKPSVTPQDSKAPATLQADTAIPFRDLVTELSEPDAAFFSDNFISNETSYLQIGADLEKRAAAGSRRADEPDSFSTTAGGVYLGVGPEQNFTYIALSRPRLAFIVDIRRQNLILHLLYKALFDEATSRSHFLTLLLGRPYDKATEPGPPADIGRVLAHAEWLAPDEATFSRIHERARGRIEKQYGIKLDAKDLKSLETSHRAFFRDQLKLRFSLRASNGRAYPTLRELLRTKSPDGRELGFLARESDFRFVQAMQREHRLIPIVGDFAGDRAMPGIAAYLRQKGLTVSTFYVSNVEQYLFEGKVWDKWARNIAALPVDAESVFLRAYLDQGRSHPKQMKGHRTATLVQRIAHFNERQKERPYGTFWAVAIDEAGDETETAARPAF
jgi:hypothetical protein